MNRYLIAGFSALLLSAVVAPAQAEPAAINPYVVNTEAASQLTPAELVSLANRGYLKNEGIPSYSVLSVGYDLGLITAKDIVQAGIQAKRLPAEAANDQGYLNAVDAQFQAVYTVR